MNTSLQKFAPLLLFVYTLLLCFFISRLPFDFEKFGALNYDMLPRMIAGFSVLLLLLMHFGKFDVSRYFSFGWLAFNLFVLTAFSAIFILFKDVHVGLNGLMGDACFNAAMVTKYKYFNSLTDFNYAQLTTSYPALYHFILGKYAAFFKLPSYTVIHHGYIFTYCLLSLPVYFMARKSAGATVAVSFVLFMFLNFPADNLYKPYEFITACVFLFWWMNYVEQPSSGFKNIVAGGLIGAAIFLTYYYWFFIAATYLFIKLLSELNEQRSIKKLFELRRSAVLILLLSALFSSIYWLPLVFQFATHGVESLQNMWMSPEMVEFSFLNEQSLMVKLVLGAGAAIPFFFPKNNAMSVCRWMLMAITLWFFMGYIMLYIGKPTVANKIHYLLFAFCSFSVFYFLFELLEWQTDALKQTAITIAFSALFIFGIDNFLELKNHPFFSNVSAYNIPNHQQNSAFAESFKGKVMLTDRQHINAFIPVHYLININAHFSHPASQFRQRIDFLKALEDVRNPDVLAWFLTYNKFDKTDFLYFSNDAVLSVYDDNYPKGHRAVTIALTNEIYASQYVRPFATLEGEAGTVYELLPPPFSLKENFSKQELQLADKFAKQF